jgi:hypothetical protein
MDPGEFLALKLNNGLLSWNSLSSTRTRLYYGRAETAAPHINLLRSRLFRLLTRGTLLYVSQM